MSPATGADGPAARPSPAAFAAGIAGRVSPPTGMPVAARAGGLVHDRDAQPDDAPRSHGERGVEQALARLDDLTTRPVAEHVDVFDAVHRLLQDSLATLDGG